MLRGLNSEYRHAIPAITAMQPPHTFLFARSYLLLEEHYDKEHAKTAAQHALVATGGSRPSSSPAPDGSFGGSSSGQPTAPQPAAVSKGAPHHNDNRGRGRGRGGYNHSGGYPQAPAPRAPSGWTPGFNPWRGMVQAWSMPFRAPGAGVLGPRPGASPNQAYFTGSAAPPLDLHNYAPTPSAATPDIWNNQAFLAALAPANVPASGPQTAEWFLDTGASSHMVTLLPLNHSLIPLLSLLATARNCLSLIARPRLLPLLAHLFFSTMFLCLLLSLRI